MSTINSISARVAELSATLQSLDELKIDYPNENMYMIAEDFCSYNSSFYCNGWIKPYFEDTFKISVVQKVEEYQVIRIFGLDVHMEGLAHDEVPEDWEDEDAPEFPDLEVDNLIECKQIWISKTDCQTIVLDKPYDDALREYNSESINVLGLHDFCHSETNANKILSEVQEEGVDRESLTWCLSLTREYLEHTEPQFLSIIEKYDLCSWVNPYKRFFKMAHRHGWNFPTTIEDTRMWLEHIGILIKLHQETDVRNICPQDLHTAHQQLIATYQAFEERRRAIQRKQAELEQIKRAKKEELDFSINHSYLFDIHFDNGHFKFDSLDSVEAYRLEGKNMHHCIFACGYYKKHDVLSMHVSDMEGNRVATCSIDVVKGKIIELQTLCNNSAWREGEEYKEIWNVLTARKKYFPKPKRKRNKKQLKIAV